MCPSSGLWGGVLDCDSQFTILSPPSFDGHNHPIVRFAYLYHMIGEELVFFSFLYIKLVELGVEVALNHRSAVTHHKVHLLKFSTPEQQL